MLIIDNLRQSYDGHETLDGLCLRLNAGEVYALLGPNGAGKTTTIHCILGFIAAQSGSIHVDDIDAIAAPHLARRLIAYIPEQVSLYENFSALENLRYFAELSGRHLDNKALADLLDRAGLDTTDHARNVSGYSKGMRQKVGIAIALARESHLLLLDEPTSGLDPSAANEFGDLLRTLAGQGVAVLMATHDLFRAREEASRVGILKNGKLALELSGDEVQRQNLETAYLDTIGYGVIAK